MANRISDNIVKAFEKFNADLKAFGEETNEEYITLYEDANTTRMVKDFRLYKNGKLTWKEQESYGEKVTSESETMIDDYDAKNGFHFGGRTSGGQSGIGQWTLRPLIRYRMLR